MLLLAQAGDQLLRVDGQSLVGITQERAAEIMMHTGPVVELEVAKQGAIYHGLATLLSQPSPVLSSRANGSEQQQRWDFLPSQMVVKKTHKILLSFQIKIRVFPGRPRPCPRVSRSVGPAAHLPEPGLGRRRLPSPAPPQHHSPRTRPRKRGRPRPRRHRPTGVRPLKLGPESPPQLRPERPRLRLRLGPGAGLLPERDLRRATGEVRPPAALAPQPRGDPEGGRRGGGRTRTEPG